MFAGHVGIALAIGRVERRVNVGVFVGAALVGLALWNSLFAALGVEALVVAVGLYVFVPGSGLSRSRSVTLTVLTLIVLVFTVAV